jgi:hypothetical protein
MLSFFELFHLMENDDDWGFAGKAAQLNDPNAKIGQKIGAVGGGKKISAEMPPGHKEARTGQDFHGSVRQSISDRDARLNKAGRGPGEEDDGTFDPVKYLTGAYPKLSNGRPSKYTNPNPNWDAADLLGKMRTDPDLSKGGEFTLPLLMNKLNLRHMDPERVSKALQAIIHLPQDPPVKMRPNIGLHGRTEPVFTFAPQPTVSNPEEDRFGIGRYTNPVHSGGVGSVGDQAPAAPVADRSPAPFIH